MAYRPYLTDTNGRRVYEGEQVFRYETTEEGMLTVYGILKLTPADDPNAGLYKWSVDWEDTGMEYWIGLLPLWTGNKPDAVYAPDAYEPDEIDKSLDLYFQNKVGSQPQ